MNNLTTKYNTAVASYTARAAAIARARGLSVEVKAPFVKLRRRRSHASLVFHPSHIVLEMIEVEPRDRYQRYGSAMLGDVIAIGDALRLRIDLIAESAAFPEQPGLVQSKLESWYRRHEFSGPNDALMRRVPTSTSTH